MEEKANDIMKMVENCLNINKNGITAKEGYSEMEEELINIYKFSNIFSNKETIAH